VVPIEVSNRWLMFVQPLHHRSIHRVHEKIAIHGSEQKKREVPVDRTVYEIPTCLHSELMIQGLQFRNFRSGPSRCSDEAHSSSWTDFSSANTLVCISCLNGADQIKVIYARLLCIQRRDTPVHKNIMIHDER
jgi:hypothetical protein